MKERVIGEREFTDGARRTVKEDEQGQYVEADGERVYGVWVWPEADGMDTPFIVIAGSN
jgi:hypothetical protein